MDEEELKRALIAVFPTIEPMPEQNRRMKRKVLSRLVPEPLPWNCSYCQERNEAEAKWCWYCERPRG